MAKKTFRGGVHPHDFKALAKDAPIRDLALPELLTVPMSQHIGRPATPVVKATDTVRRGDLLGEAAGFVSANVHAPTSGTVKRIVRCNTPTGLVCDAVLLAPDGEDAWAEGLEAETDPLALEPKAIVGRAQAAGLVGMGGATFPTHVKLSPPDEKPIDTVILNGVECEPFLTADYRLMLERPTPIVEGLRLAMKAVGCARGIIGIEANKPDAAEILREACEKVEDASVRLSVELLPVKYPQGAEKQLIQALLGREVPSGGLPMDVGVVVQNVATAAALAEACRSARPLTERIVTVTGEGVDAPCNLRARIGTPIGNLLDEAGFDPARTRKLVCGGPMMGMAHFDLEMPVNKGLSGLLALVDPQIYPHRNCIRCGRCVRGCPQGLMPSELSLLVESGRFHEARERNLLDCMECGVCTYQCPSRRPIVQWVKLAKYELARERAREAARAE